MFGLHGCLCGASNGALTKHNATLLMCRVDVPMESSFFGPVQLVFASGSFLSWLLPYFQTFLHLGSTNTFIDTEHAHVLKIHSKKCSRVATCACLNQCSCPKMFVRPLAPHVDETASFIIHGPIWLNKLDMYGEYMNK